MLASAYGQRELVKLLLKHGAKVNIEDDVRVNKTRRLQEGLIDSLQGKERACRAMCSDVCICDSVHFGNPLYRCVWCVHASHLPTKPYWSSPMADHMHGQ